MSHAIRYPMTGAYRAAAELYAGLLAAAASAPDDDSARTLPEWRPADPDDVAELYALAIDRTWRDGRWHVELKAPVQDHASPMMAMHGPERPAGACRALVVFEPEPGVRSSCTIAGTRPRLLAMADTVRKNWGRYGGGQKPAELVPVPKARRASWPAAALKVWREQIECNEWADVLHLGLSALGGRVYQGAGRAAFMVVAPLQVEGLPAEFASARRDDGQWVVYDTVSGRAIGQRGAGSRKAAEEHARGEWERVDPDRRALGVSDARRAETIGADDALAAWCQAHGIGAEPVPAESDQVADTEPAVLAPDVAPVDPVPAVPAILQAWQVVAAAASGQPGAETLAEAEALGLACLARYGQSHPAACAHPASFPAWHADTLQQLRAAAAQATAPAAAAADPAMVAELVASHEASEAGAASLDRLATADSEFAARLPLDSWGRSAYAAQRAADCRAAAAQIRAALATPTQAADPAPADVAALAHNLGSLQAMHAELSAELLRLQRSKERGAGAMARRLRERLENVDAAASMTARRLSEAAPMPSAAAPAAAAAPVHPRPRMAESLALLAEVANARSARAADELALKAAGLVRDDGRGWLSLTPAGRDALQAGGYRFHPAAGCGWMLAEPVADAMAAAPPAYPVPAARDGVDDRAARLAALVVGIIGTDPARLAPALRRESARVAAAAESVPGRIADGYRRTARALADMATAEHARAAPDRDTLAPDAPRPDPAALVAELDQITAAVRDRMGGRTGPELSAMTPAELARRHAILQQLPTFAEERQAARQRIAARLEARQARPAPARAAPPADGWRTIAARPAPAGAFAGLAVQAPGSPCSDIGAAAVLLAAAPDGWRWRPGAPVWRGRRPACAFPAPIGAAGGTRCSDIGTDINPAARRGHHVENLKCQISQPTPPAAPSSSFRTAWSSRPLSCRVTQQAGRSTSTLHRSWPSVPPAGLKPGCSPTAQKTTPPDCWPRGTRSTWLQAARVMPSWTISSTKRRQKISAAAVSATSRDGPDELRCTMSTRPGGIAARVRRPGADPGPPRIATSAHQYEAGQAPPARSLAAGQHPHPPRVATSAQQRRRP